MNEAQKIKWKNKLITYFPPVRLGLLLLLFILIMTLFVPPANGLADNGSYTAILKSNGLYEIPGNQAYYSSFVPQFRIMQYFNPEQYHMLSLQNVFIQIALILNKLFYSTKIFDIRFLSVLYTILYLLAMWILLRGITKKLVLKRQYLIVLVIVFLLGDTSYIVYFNSFYRTPILFILLILYIGLNIAAYQQSSLKGMFVYFVLEVMVALLIPSVTQISGIFMLGVTVSLFGMLLFVQDKRYKMAITLFVVALLPLSFFVSSIVMPTNADKEKFNSMSTGVLQVTDNPGKALANLGMEPQYEMMRGVDYDQTYVIEKSGSHSVKEHFIAYIHIWRTSMYYLFHPGELLAMLDIGLENQNMLTNQKTTKIQKSALVFQKAQDVFLKGATRIKAAFLPKKFPFYLLLSIVIIAVYSVVAVRGLQLGTNLYVARLLNKIGLVLMILMSFIAPVVVMGATNMVQEMEVSSLILDLMLIAIFGDYLRHDLWIDKKQVMLYKVSSREEK